MTLARSMPAALACLMPAAAAAQTSYMAPDGHNRFPAVTIFCPSGTGVTPCSFGSSGSGGAVSINQGGAPVSSSNRLPVGDALLDGLISGGALSIGGTVSLSGSPTVNLGSGSAVSVSNLPAIQPVSGAVSQSGSWTVGLASGSASIGQVGVASLPPLPAGGNAIGSVAVSNLPATQAISGAVSQAGTWSVGLASGTAVGLSAGSNPIGSVTVSNLPGTQTVSGAVAQSGTWSVGLSAGATVGLASGTNPIGSVSVSNLPATQPVSASALPLPAGAATAMGQAASLGPVAPGAATATNATVIGCLANTTLPSFTAGQQGAIACDTSGRPYVVTVPSANNVPTYLQAVTSGGAAIFRAMNIASSAMATNVKASTGMVYAYEACNSGSAAVYLRLFALAAAPTVGTSVPVATKLLTPGSCQETAVAVGLVFSNGIGFDVTSGSMADADTATVAAANQVSVQIYYK